MIDETHPRLTAGCGSSIGAAAGGYTSREAGFNVPVVVRLEGTNVEIARKMLGEASIAGLTTASDLTDAARRVCAAV